MVGVVSRVVVWDRSRLRTSSGYPVRVAGAKHSFLPRLREMKPVVASPVVARDRDYPTPGTCAFQLQCDLPDLRALYPVPGSC